MRLYFLIVVETGCISVTYSFFTGTNDFIDIPVESCLHSYDTADPRLYHPGHQSIGIGFTFKDNHRGVSEDYGRALRIEALKIPEQKTGLLGSE